MTNPLRQLSDAGQSVWLDFLDRRMLEAGGLRRLIELDDVGGVTSNPAIFEKAIGQGDAYDAALRARLEAGDAEVVELYEHLAIADIQSAADQLAPLWKALDGADGFVSLEVSPYLAHDTEGTLEEARRLWLAVGRPNLMIKVPGTPAGARAIRTLIGEGINVNVTLLFSQASYAAAAEAHIAGLESLKAWGGDVSKVHGVASLFVSRVDGVIDGEIDARLAAAPPAEAEALKALRGQVAIANAKLAYQHYLGLIASPRWQALAAAGASPQRLLWASTGTKDPAYLDVYYAEALIGRDTVDTMPPATLDAFRDHGRVRRTLTEGVDAAHRALAEAERLGLDLAKATAELTVDGVGRFAQAFDQLLGAVADKRARILGDRLNGQKIAAGGLADSFQAALTRAASEGWGRRLWARDASLWPGDEAGKWLGWLDAAKGEAVDLGALEALRTDVAAAGFTHALLLGMGGSSLGPEVLAATFGSGAGFPALLVLDSTDPDQIARIAGQIDPARTLFIVASKSGSTLEPDILHRFFFDLVERALGVGQAGGRFIAITDPGSKLEATARAQGFWKIFPGLPSIGGRYSVLSNFGLVPAAVIGLEPRQVFTEAAAMVRACGSSAPPAANPGVALGVLLGVAAHAGRDKATFSASPSVAALGAWLEQLIAESTGKQGKGIIPVDGEPLGAPETYAADRLFCDLRLAGEDEAGRDDALSALEAAGHPVVRITLADPSKLFQEFFRWEVATAIAGAVIGIDPFDQPDVEDSKVKTRALTDAFERDGALAAAEPLVAADGVSLFADAANAAALAPYLSSPQDALAAHFARAGAGDYVGLLAYLDRDPDSVAALQALRLALRARLGLATVAQFGPRFLHSTGQAYKGGPNSGMFLQITADPAHDLAVPGRAASFAVVEAAQAQGDFAVLAERGRRLLRVHLGADPQRGFAWLSSAVDRIAPRS